MILTVLRTTGQISCRMLFMGICRFSHDEVRAIDLGTKTTEGKCHFHQTLSKVPAISTVYDY